MNKMRPQINRHTTKLVLQMKRTQCRYVLDVSGKLSKISKHQNGIYLFRRISVNYQCELPAFLWVLFVCGGFVAGNIQYRSTGAYLNVTMCECIIEMCNPQAAGELCVMERAGLHHSLHRRLDASRVRETDSNRETEREKGGGGETPYWQHEWYIIWLSWTELFSLTAYTALSNCPPFHKPWWTDLLHSTKLL